MKLTKKRAIEEHRKMWNWIAEQYENETDILLELHDIDRLKRCYIDDNYMELFDLKIESNCFCCAYDYLYDGDCSHCPLDWGNNNNNDDVACMRMDNGAGLFETIDILTHENSSKEKLEVCGKIARKIANLPERNINGRGEVI